MLLKVKNTIIRCLENRSWKNNTPLLAQTSDWSTTYIKQPATHGKHQSPREIFTEPLLCTANNDPSKKQPGTLFQNKCGTTAEVGGIFVKRH